MSVKFVDLPSQVKARMEWYKELSYSITDELIKNDEARITIGATKCELVHIQDMLFNSITDEEKAQYFKLNSMIVFYQDKKNDEDCMSYCREIYKLTKVILNRATLDMVILHEGDLKVS